jgi:beta-glucosidase
MRYSNLRVSPASDGGVDVGFTVQNIGPMTGAEVPQVYAGPSPDAPSDIQQAVRKLVQFDRITLPPDRSQAVTLHVAPRQLS